MRLTWGLSAYQRSIFSSISSSDIEVLRSSNLSLNSSYRSCITSSRDGTLVSINVHLPMVSFTLVGKTINSPLLTHKIAISLSLMRIYVLYFSDVYHCPNLKLTHKSAHGHFGGMQVACLLWQRVCSEKFPSRTSLSGGFGKEAFLCVPLLLGSKRAVSHKCGHEP